MRCQIYGYVAKYDKLLYEAAFLDAVRGRLRLSGRTLAALSPAPQPSGPDQDAASGGRTSPGGAATGRLASQSRSSSGGFSSTSSRAALCGFATLGSSPTGPAPPSSPGVGSSSLRCRRRHPRRRSPVTAQMRRLTGVDIEQCPVCHGGGCASSPSSARGTSRPWPWTAHEAGLGDPPADGVFAPLDAEGGRRVSPRVSAGPPEPRTASPGPRSTSGPRSRPRSLCLQAPSLGPRVRIQSP